VSIHTASRIDTRLGLVLGLGLGLSSQTSRVYLPQMAIHTATGEASRVYSINHNFEGVETSLPCLALHLLPYSVMRAASVMQGCWCFQRQKELRVG